MEGYAHGFFAEDVALYRFRKTRAGSVPAGVFGGRRPHGVLVTDRYTGYDRPWRGDRQYRYAHILRKLLRLPKKEPDNKEYRAFVPPMAEQLRAAMKLRSRGSSARGLRPRGRGGQVQDRRACKQEREGPGASERPEHLQGTRRQDVPLGEGP